MFFLSKIAVCVYFQKNIIPGWIFVNTSINEKCMCMCVCVCMCMSQGMFVHECVHE